MAPNSTYNPKVRTGLKRSAYHNGDDKTSCKKWCYHPTHDGVGPQIKPKRWELERDGFPCGIKTYDAFYKFFENDEVTLKKTLQNRGQIRKNYCNCSLLHIAVRWEEKEMLKALLDTCSPNVVNRYNQTPAHLAALRGNIDLLKILISHENFNPHQRDIWNNTYKDVLSAPLFTAVLWSDTEQIEELLKLGADPDGHAGKFVDGIMARELKATTPRELAIALKKTSIIDIFVKHTQDKPSMDITVDENTPPISDISLKSKGFVSIFSYASFQGLNLENQAAKKDVDNVARVFSEMGYNGDIYSSLSAEETLEALENIRHMEMLKDAEVLVFYFSGLVANKAGGSFLTSNRKALNVDSILNFFSDSKCPSYLKNKNKIFIFDLCRLPNDEIPCPIPWLPKSADTTPYTTRSQGSPQNTACIYSSLRKNPEWDFTQHGSFFNRGLCDLLSKDGQNVYVGEIFEKLRKEAYERNLADKIYLVDYNYEWNFHFTGEAPPTRKLDL